MRHPLTDGSMSNSQDDAHFHLPITMNIYQCLIARRASRKVSATPRDRIHRDEPTEPATISFVSRYSDSRLSQSRLSHPLLSRRRPDGPACHCRDGQDPQTRRHVGTRVENRPTTSSVSSVGRSSRRLVRVRDEKGRIQITCATLGVRHRWAAPNAGLAATTAIVSRLPPDNYYFSRYLVFPLPHC